MTKETDYEIFSKIIKDKDFNEDKINTTSNLENLIKFKIVRETFFDKKYYTEDNDPFFREWEREYRRKYSQDWSRIFGNFTTTSKEIEIPQPRGFYELVFGSESERVRSLDDNIENILNTLPVSETDNGVLRKSLQNIGIDLSEEELVAALIRLEERRFFPLIMQINQNDLAKSRNQSLSSVSFELRNKKTVLKRLRFWHPDKWSQYGMPQEQLGAIEEIAKTLTLLKDAL